MKETVFLPGFVLAFLAIVALAASAHSGALDGVSAGDVVLRIAELDVVRHLELLNRDSSVLFRQDVLRFEGAPSPGDPLTPRNDATRFWLPDTLETGWRASDKKLHLFACYSIVLTGEVAADRWETGAIWAAGLSVGKELWDLWFKTPVSRRGVSKGDLIADAVGIGAGIFVIQAFGD